MLALKKDISTIKKGRTAIKGVITSYKMFRAGQKAGLRTESFIVNGKRYYRVLATREALKRLGIEPDVEAESALNKLLPKNERELSLKQQQLAETNAATLKYATKKEGNLAGQIQEKLF